MSRAHHQHGAQPSQRMLRVAELIRHALSDLLARGTLGEPELEKQVITVADVRMSPDLKLATVYVMPLGGGELKPVIDALENHKKLLRGELAHRINMKFAPDLRFKADSSFDYGQKMDALLESPKVKGDLLKPADDDLSHDDVPHDD
jgi:ribosome-binding factor A